MPIYRMDVVCQTLFIDAENQEQAEEKYSAHFAFNEVCPCGDSDCECVEETEDVFHTTTEEPAETCGACGQFYEGTRANHFVECDENPNNQTNDDNANPDNHFTAPKESN